MSVSSSSSSSSAVFFFFSSRITTAAAAAATAALILSTNPYGCDAFTTTAVAAGAGTSVGAKGRIVFPSSSSSSSSLGGSSPVPTTPNDGDRSLSEGDCDTIRSGGIAIVRNFIPPEEILALRTDARNLHRRGEFSTDALASYGASGQFDPSRDRAVLRLDRWRDRDAGSWDTRRRFGNRMASLRSELARRLDRPDLNRGLATTEYGYGSTEISYTRFGPGAFLRRHVDEHHEELKGRAGWSRPTRRSLSWLIYLNEADWNGSRDGGQLRCFRRADAPATNGRNVLGARPNGDLQIAWLRATAFDPAERPVYLDGRRPDHKCGMYVVDDDRPRYITKDFDANPILYVAGSETLIRRALLSDRRDLADRFHLIEPPKSKLGDLLSGRTTAGDYAGQGESPAPDEILEDVNPVGGTLVIFDSVALPHEVLATRNRERWAASGWFHEDQQPPKLIPRSAEEAAA